MVEENRVKTAMEVIHETKRHKYYRTVKVDKKRRCVKITVTSLEKGKKRRSVCVLDRTYTARDGEKLTSDQLDRIKVRAQIDFLAAMVDGLQGPTRESDDLNLSF